MSMIPVGVGSSGYEISKSLRFRASASTSMSRTPVTASNRRTWTWSGWVKRGVLGGNQQLMYADNTTTSDQTNISLFSDRFYIYSSSSVGPIILDAYTTALIRDPSAWYHVVFSVDTTQATSTARYRIFVNGVQQTLTIVDNLGQNWQTHFNLNVLHTLGNNEGTSFFDGYLADVHFIDGLALTSDSFGEFDQVGVWQPKRYNGTYGTNGFYLRFNNGSSTQNLGLDSSGNVNNWTPANFSLTAGPTYDWMDDTPTNNFPVLNPINFYVDSAQVPTGFTALSEGNLFLPAPAGGAFYSAYNSSFAVSSGKWYVELTSVTGGSGGGGSFGCFVLGSTTLIANSSISVPSYAVGTVMALAVDVTAGTGTKYVNNSSIGTFTFTAGATIIFNVSLGNSPGAKINFGQRPFTYTPPAGFLPQCTKNLEPPSIWEPRKHFDATTFTGSGSARSITGINFQPDLVWGKSRSNILSHNIYDVLRGATIGIASDLNGAEFTSAQGLTSFNSNGFSLGTDGNLNGFGQTSVAWLWKGGGAGVTNTAGTITSTVSANTQAGFSIVTYTGTNANATVGHGLGVVPRMIMIKTRNLGGASYVWDIYTQTTGAQKVFRFSTEAAATGANVYPSVPTSTVFSIGTSTSQGVVANYVAYCFAEVPGFSRIGSYVGNGVIDGPFVWCGFRPRWILIKGDLAGGSWIIHDTARSPTNVAPQRLFPNVADAELTTQPGDIDILSSGFKIRNTSGSWNATGSTYVFMAIAETPFQFARAR